MSNMSVIEPEWQFHQFDSLSARALFDVLKLRVDVFVVEQNCAYPDVDDLDQAASTWHVLGYAQKELVAYARAMPSEEDGDGAAGTRRSGHRSASRIGRVVVAKPYRGRGIARSLMTHLLEHVQHAYPDTDQVLSAQCAVQSFYASLGFVPVSKPYVEDGIEHIDMRRSIAPVIVNC